MVRDNHNESPKVRDNLGASDVEKGVEAEAGPSTHEAGDHGHCNELQEERQQHDAEKEIECQGSVPRIALDGVHDQAGEGDRLFKLLAKIS